MLMSEFKPNLELKYPFDDYNNNRVKPIKYTENRETFHDFEIKLVGGEVVNLREFCNGKTTVVMFTNHRSS